MKIVFYENQNIIDLYPITYTRAGFDIYCGAATLHQVVSEIFKCPVDFSVRTDLAKTAAAKYRADKSDSDLYLFLDASLIPSFDAACRLLNIIKGKKRAVIKNSDKIIGYLSEKNDINPSVDLLLLESTEKIEIDWPVFNYSWDTIIYNQKILGPNLEYLKNKYTEIKPGIFVGQNVVLPDNAVFQTKEGIIIIDDNSKVLPFSYLAGPVYIGPDCLIKEFASIKGHCCFGPVCKIGGEVEATIIQGYANKQHYGFLGHSFLGEWINIAAGTSNSDLKNTYSPVKMGSIQTDQQFLGTVIGDFSRTAINTSIFTGRIIGVSSFIYGTITRDIVSFTNYAAHLGCVIELALPVAQKAQAAMFARRGRQQTKFDLALLETVFHQTADERLAQGIKPGRLEFKI